MKKSLLFLACCLIASLANLAVNAQITDPKQTASQGATDHANNNISGGINNSLDKTEGAITPEGKANNRRVEFVKM